MPVERSLYGGARGDSLVGGDRRSCTVTFGYGNELRTLVAINLRLALAAALRRWGKWSTIESISTPATVYSDVTGSTRARRDTNLGQIGGHKDELSKLRHIGYEPQPGELGSVRYDRRLHD